MCWRMVTMRERGFLLVMLAFVSDAASIMIGSGGINLTRDGPQGFKLSVAFLNQSRVFNLRLEERSENVWLVGEEGELIKTEKQVSCMTKIPSYIIKCFTFPYNGC